MCTPPALPPKATHLRCAWPLPSPPGPPFPKSAVHGLFDSLSQLCAPGSKLYFDFMHRAALEGRREYPGFRITAKVREAFAAQTGSNYGR